MFQCHSTRRRASRATSAAVAASVLSLTGAASAGGEVDLVVDEVTVSQAIRFFSTPLVGNNVTFVRAFVSNDASSTTVEGVDARLHVYIGDEEVEWSPIYSINGPITVTPSQSELNIDSTVNFWFVAPQAFNVDLKVVLNPHATVEETNYDNNIGNANDMFFRCRDTVELVYVPVDYTPGGGQPAANLIEPGIGDGFVRAIYNIEEWEYHQSPLPPLVWTTNINDSNNAFLNTLRDIRISQLPQAGFDIPTFVYGWLPGNPFGGNGQANGIPGDVAFGNTQTSRHQRTFAHELGHLLDEPHNSETVGQTGVDAEHHLRNTQNISQLHASTKFDIMVAGQLTTSAFVSNSTYGQTHGDSRLQCNGALAGANEPTELLRVSGVFDHVTRTLDLDTPTWIERGLVDPDQENGELDLIAYGAAGQELHRVRGANGTNRALCDGKTFADDSPLHRLIPAAVAGVPVTRLVIEDRFTGATLADLERSAHAPVVAFTGLTEVIEGGPAEGAAPAGAIEAGMTVEGRVHVSWSATDADGDALTSTLYYSPDAGASWLPIAVRQTGTGFTFDVDDIPASREVDGILRLVTSDGLNHSETQTPMLSFAGAGQPEVYIITPNTGGVVRVGGNFIMHGYAWDREDGTISDQIEWVSNVDGVVGVGSYVQNSTLSGGAHIITARIIDSDSNEATDTAFCSLPLRTLATADQDYNGTVDFNDLLVILAAWGPCPDICAADLNTDGTVDFNDLLALLSAWTG